MTRRTNSLKAQILLRIAGILVIAVLAVPVHCAADKPATPPQPAVDMYLFAGQWPIFIGSSIGYTVFTPVKVEGRILGVTGEIILVLQEGVKQPGVYKLPFDGYYHGTPLAGYYTFELYFGDDFAFKSQLVAIPAQPAS